MQHDILVFKVLLLRENMELVIHGDHDRYMQSRQSIDICQDRRRLPDHNVEFGRVVGKVPQYCLILGTILKRRASGHLTSSYQTTDVEEFSKA